MAGKRIGRRSALVALALPVGGVLGVFVGADRRARADDDAGENATLTYRITRDGRDLGRQSMIFHTKDGATEVEIDSHVQVTIAGKQVYEFAQTMREIWRDRRLIQFHAVTNDNGERHTVELSPSAGRSLLVADGQQGEVPVDIAPTTLWHPFMLKRSMLFDTLHGNVRHFKLRDEGDVSVRIGGRDMLAHCFVLTGEIRRKLWYAPGDQLLRMVLPARDGSEVVFEVMR